MESQNSRPSRDQTYLRIALEISRRGTCGRAQVGCVITRDNRIISTGYNGPPSGAQHCNYSVCDTGQTCTRAVHAEVNAIAFAAKEGISTDGATLYCMYSPCVNCAKMIIQAGIKRVVFIREYKTLEGNYLLSISGITLNQIYENSL